MNAAAFFDFDKTIIHGDAGPAFGVWLFMRRRRRISERHAKPVAAARRTAMWSKAIPFMAWMTLQSSLYKARAVRRSSLVRSAYKGFKGTPVELIETLVDEFVNDEIGPLVYPKVRHAMEDHIAAGDRCVIVTTGMQRLVEHCLRFLPEGVEVIGCELEERHGRLTGRIESGPLYGADKANIVLAYCQAAGIDPERCTAYTDHYSDYHMLDAVGDGVCINPAGRLRRMAQAKGWKVWDLDDPRP